jgi:hypothetical protein
MTARILVPRMVGVLLVFVTAGGCGDDEVIEMQNTGASPITVTFSGGNAETIEAQGGAAVYTDECYNAPTVVTLGGGRVVKLSQSLCPGQRLLITDEDARIEAAVSG